MSQWDAAYGWGDHGTEGYLTSDTLDDLAQRMRFAIQQAAVLLIGQGVGVAGVAEQQVEAGEVAGQGAERAQQAAPGWVALQVQVVERGMQVFQGLAAQLAVFERLAQLDGAAQALAGFAVQAQQALAAKQHIAVEEGFGQFVVRVVRRAGAFVNVLGEEVQLQVAIDLGAGAAIADPMQNDLLGGVEC